MFFAAIRVALARAVSRVASSVEGVAGFGVWVTLGIIAGVVAKRIGEACSHDALSPYAAFGVILAADANSGHAHCSGTFGGVLAAKFGLTGLGEKRAEFIFGTIVI